MRSSSSVYVVLLWVVVMGMSNYALASPSAWVEKLILQSQNRLGSATLSQTHDISQIGWLYSSTLDRIQDLSASYLQTAVAQTTTQAGCGITHDEIIAILATTSQFQALTQELVTQQSLEPLEIPGGVFTNACIKYNNCKENINGSTVSYSNLTYSRKNYERCTSDIGTIFQDRFRALSQYNELWEDNRWVEIFMNGTISDSSRDLLVDMEQISKVLFGNHKSPVKFQLYTIPTSVSNGLSPLAMRKRDPNKLLAATTNITPTQSSIANYTIDQDTEVLWLLWWSTATAGSNPICATGSTTNATPTTQQLIDAIDVFVNQTQLYNQSLDTESQINGILPDVILWPDGKINIKDTPRTLWTPPPNPSDAIAVIGPSSVAANEPINDPIDLTTTTVNEGTVGAIQDVSTSSTSDVIAWYTDLQWNFGKVKQCLKSCSTKSGSEKVSCQAKCLCFKVGKQVDSEWVEFEWLAQMRFCLVPSKHRPITSNPCQWTDPETGNPRNDVTIECLIDEMNRIVEDLKQSDQTKYVASTEMIENNFKMDFAKQLKDGINISFQTKKSALPTQENPIALQQRSKDVMNIPKPIAVALGSTAIHDRMTQFVNDQISVRNTITDSFIALQATSASLMSKIKKGTNK